MNLCLPFGRYGFGSAFYILFRSDDNEEFSTIYYAFLNMFEHQYGDLELAPMYKSNNPVRRAGRCAGRVLPDAGCGLHCGSAPRRPT